MREALKAIPTWSASAAVGRPAGGVSRLLQRAYDWAMLMAQKTRDAGLCRSWLEDVPENRAILAEYHQVEMKSRIYHSILRVGRPAAG